MKPATPQEVAAPSASSLEPTLYSQDGEQMAISVLFNTAREKMHHKLTELLSPDDFFVEQHRNIWSLVKAMRDAGQPADPAAVLDAARRAGDIFVGGPQYMVECLEFPLAKHASDEAVLANARRIKDYAMLRRLQSTLRQGISLTESGRGFAEVMGFVEDDLINLKRITTTSRTGPQQAAVFYQANLERIITKLDDPDAKTDVISTGMPHLDRLLNGGLAPETLTVIAARPAMGKTVFAINIEQNIISQSRPTLFFSLEMKGEALTGRALARHARVPLSDIKQAALPDTALSRVLEAAEELGHLPAWIDESPGLTLSEIRSRARMWAAQHPGGVIFLDYMGLVAGSKPNVDRNALITEVSMGLKNLARELKVPVVALSQLNRDLEKRANKRPMMSDLRESGQIEQDAETIIFIYRDEVYNPDTPDKGVAEVIIGKNRDGSTSTVRMAFDGPTMRFSEIDVYEAQE